ncbi:MAG: TIGR04086 family membrane protein [Bacillota bacterium]|nr:TIGR04086 family membrane protein [Bacillota bacterium]
MEILRKTLKAYILAILLFIVLTLVLAAVINFTGFKEEWAFAGLVAILSVVTLLLGFLEGRIMERKGLLAGLGAAIVFLLLVLFAVGSVFSRSFGVESFSVFYLIPLASGMVGGVLGTNSSK